MSKKMYDDFIKLPVTKMAESISDMTYEYKGTEVPKNHYQKILQQEVIGLLAQDSTMELVLLNAVLNQLQALKKESPKLFFKAMFCLDNNIKVDKINNRIYDSLENTFIKHEKDKSILNENILDTYNMEYETHKELPKIVTEIETIDKN